MTRPSGTHRQQQIAVLQGLLQADGHAARLRLEGAAAPGPGERWREAVEAADVPAHEEILLSLSRDGFIDVDGEGTSFIGLTTAGRRLAQIGCDW